MSVRSRLEGTPDVRMITGQPVDVAEQDPSMPGVPTVAAPTTSLAPIEIPESPVVPAAEVPAAPVAEEVPEKRHEWQPVDEDGIPMGGVQVIIYRTEQELLQKMQEKSVLLLRQLRRERREKALGHVEERVDDAEKFQNVVEFKPRELTADERFKISQGLANPETFADARDQLIESVFGAKSEKVASTLNEVERFMIQQRAVQNYIEFVQSSDFVDTPKNRELVTGWLGKRNFAPTVANFIIAQTRLKEAGLLQEAPVVQQEPVLTPVVAPVAPIATVIPTEQEPKPQVPTTPSPALVTQESQAKRHSHVPSGLTPSVASPAGSPPAVGTSLTLADIDKMSSDEYKVRLRDPKFRILVDTLEADAAKRRRERALNQ
jgi:hypothetical protein